MTGWTDILAPAPVYCDGCGQLIAHGEPTQTEHVSTPLGRCLRKTRVRAARDYCLSCAAKRVDGACPRCGGRA
jgi:hypothetical protein